MEPTSQALHFVLPNYFSRWHWNPWWHFNVPCVPVPSDDCFGLPPIFILCHISYYTSKNDIWILDLERIFHHHTLPKTNSTFAPENGGLEDDPFSSQLKQGSLYYQLQTMHVYRETHSNLPYICINFESPQKNGCPLKNEPKILEGSLLNRATVHPPHLATHPHSHCGRQTNTCTHLANGIRWKQRSWGANFPKYCFFHGRNPTELQPLPTNMDTQKWWKIFEAVSIHFARPFRFGIYVKCRGI